MIFFTLPALAQEAVSDDLDSAAAGAAATSDGNATPDGTVSPDDADMPALPIDCALISDTLTVDGDVARQNGQYYTGKVCSFHAGSSTLAAEQVFKAGKLDGTSKNYYTNGKLQSEMPYKAGKRHGVAKFYYESTGRLSVEVHYNNDKVTKHVAR
jgi:hypothetical protein